MVSFNMSIATPPLFPNATGSAILNKNVPSFLNILTVPLFGFATMMSLSALTAIPRLLLSCESFVPNELIVRTYDIVFPVLLSTWIRPLSVSETSILPVLSTATPCGPFKFAVPAPSEPNLHMNVPVLLNTWIRLLVISVTMMLFSGSIVIPHGLLNSPSAEPAAFVAFPILKRNVPTLSNTWTRWLPRSAT